MTYQIRITAKATESLSKLPKNVQAKLADQITSLAQNPRPAGAAKIRGLDDCYRIRHGDYRVVYAVLDDELLVVVVRVGHRKDVYERIEILSRVIERFRKERN